jgi:hypothetical protein
MFASLSFTVVAAVLKLSSTDGCPEAGGGADAAAAAGACVDRFAASAMGVEAEV